MGSLTTVNKHFALTQPKAWSALARHAYAALLPHQRNAVRRKLRTIEVGQQVDLFLKKLPGSSPPLYILSVQRDTVRIVIRQYNNIWEVLDIVRLAGDFKFADVA